MTGCILLQVLFIAAAWGVSFITDPPACFIAYTFPIPFASCPGLHLGQGLEYALALPGAAIALPFVVADLWLSGAGAVQPWVMLPLGVYLLAGAYLVRLLMRGRSSAR